MIKNVWREEGHYLVDTGDVLIGTSHLGGWYIEVQKGEATADWTQEEVERHAHLIAAAPAMLEALKRMEWGGKRMVTHYEVPCCPICRGLGPGYGFGILDTGHANGCQLQAALRQAEGEE